MSGPFTLYARSETAGTFAIVDACKRNARRWARAGWKAFEIADKRAIYVGVRVRGRIEWVPVEAPGQLDASAVPPEYRTVRDFITVPREDLVELLELGWELGACFASMRQTRPRSPKRSGISTSGPRASRV